MALTLITADQRLAAPQKTNILIVGPHGLGKTSLARTLPDAGARCLFIDLEAGTKAIDGDVDLPNGQRLPSFAGAVVDVRAEATKLGVHPWEYARGIACLLCGPDPAASNAPDPDTKRFHPYSRAMFEQYKAGIADPAVFDAYDTVFVDSGSVASKMAWSWSLEQPRAMSQKTGKRDTLGAYGLVGDEMIDWATQLQHIPRKSIIVLFALDAIKDKDIPGRVAYAIQAIGSRTERELPGIFDNVVTYGLFTQDSAGQIKLDYDKGMHRGLICQPANGYGVPAKDRTGRVAAIEPPDLGVLLTKLSAAKRSDQMVTTGMAAVARDDGPMAA